MVLAEALWEVPGRIQTTSHQHSEAAVAVRPPAAAAKTLVVAAFVVAGMDFLAVVVAAPEPEMGYSQPVVAAKTSEVAVVALANQMDRLPAVAAKTFVAEVEQVQTAVARTSVGSVVVAVLVVVAMRFVAVVAEPG